MIWVIGGTKDSRDFIKRIDQNSLITTVATQYGAKLLKDLNTKVIVSRLDLDEMLDFIHINKIEKIYDLSHPYAVEVSKNAIEAAKIKNIEYIRYERKMLSYSGAKEFYNLDDLIEYIEDKINNKKIFSTLGSNNIDRFKNLNHKENLFVRVLPADYALKKCIDTDILPKNIIALQGPFSKEFNKSIFKNYNIDILITKESGDTGGEMEKIEAAKELNLEILVLKRPIIDYPVVYNKLENMIKKD